MYDLLDTAQELKELLENSGRLQDGDEIERLVLDIAQQAVDLLAD